MLRTRGTVVSHCSVHLSSLLIKLIMLSGFLENVIYPITKTVTTAKLLRSRKFTADKHYSYKKDPRFMFCIAFDK